MVGPLQQHAQCIEITTTHAKECRTDSVRVKICVDSATETFLRASCMRNEGGSRQGGRMIGSFSAARGGSSHLSARSEERRVGREGGSRGARGGARGRRCVA